MVRVEPPRPPYREPRFREEYHEEFELSTMPKPFERERYLERELVTKEFVQRKTTFRKFTNENLRSLRLLGSELLGNLFERVNFLKTRIDELNSSIITREQIHRNSIEDINKDIEDKEKMLISITNKDEIREVGMDVTTLRMEARRENLMFWRDILELRRELRELMEQHQTEMKIAELFKNFR